MNQTAEIRARRPIAGNMARLELDNIERYGVYTRLHFQDRSYTNLEELRFAGSLASVLQDYGVSPGDRVLVMMPNSPELNAAFHAIWTIGAVVVPVIPQWTPEEAAVILRGSNPKLALTVPALAPRLLQAHAGIPGTMPLLVFGASDNPALEDITGLVETAPPMEDPLDRAATDLAMLLYTSGTTGNPKGVMLTHGNLASAIDSTIRQNPDLEPGVMLHTLPLTHVYGVLVQNVANAWGWTTVLMRQFEPTRALEAIQRHKIRYMPVVPTMLVYLLNHPERHRYDISSLTRIISGGAALPERLRQECERVFDCRIDQGYGLSESASVATGYVLSNAYRSGSSGTATPGVEIYVVDDQNRPLPPKAVGEICLAGPNIAAGYWEDPVSSQEAMSGGWLHTGDIGYMDEDGFLYITDRKKDLIIKGAENISPREIEEALYLHPAVAEAAVVGIPDPVFGEEIYAVVQLKPGTQATEEEIRRHVGLHVTKFKVPARVIFESTLPKNSNGKILKRAIRAQLLSKAAAQA